MYAVNIADLTHKPEDTIPLMLLASVIDQNKPAVECEKRRFDGMGTILQCSEERAKAIISIIRTHRKRHQLRIYHSKTGKGWKRV